ncbi:MAG: hypothetical protein ACRDWI_11495 [Jiangellaceae bacterium]
MIALPTTYSVPSPTTVATIGSTRRWRQQTQPAVASRIGSVSHRCPSFAAPSSTARVGPSGCRASKNWCTGQSAATSNPPMATCQVSRASAAAAATPVMAYGVHHGREEGMGTTLRGVAGRWSIPLSLTGPQDPAGLFVQLLTACEAAAMRPVPRSADDQTR